jgi:hypothetical protein
MPVKGMMRSIAFVDKARRLNKGSIRNRMRRSARGEGERRGQSLEELKIEITYSQFLKLFRELSILIIGGI